ncbi:YaaR family protein [Natronospora cellulosivora (SeqCode)]
MRIDKNSNSAFTRAEISLDKESQKVKSKEAQFKERLAEINHHEIKERLDKLFAIVDNQGEKLKKSLDKKDLIEYKKRVKDFLRLVNKEFAKAKQSFSWDDRGNMKTYTIVEKIDDNLEALQELFLEEQADALAVLKRVDQIRGLLMDLYI